MIKINLLGESTFEKSPAFVLLIYTAAFLLCALLCVAFVYMSVSNKVSILNTEKTVLQAELSKLEERTKTVKDLDQKSKTLKNKLSVIARLKKSKIGPVKVMDDLNMAIPEKVWLREVREANGTVKIKGRALSNQHVATLMQNLQKSEYFDQVDLVESRQMYYSRSTGQVTPMTDISRLKSTDFARDKRSTKQSSGSLTDKRKSVVVVTNSSKDNESSARKRIAEENVTVNEFVLSAKVFYEGKSVGQVKPTVKK